MFDIIVKNGTIIDGTGKPGYEADLGIKEGVIREIGNLRHEHADNVIDAKGKYVTPGFVDINNHSDVFWRIFLNPELPSLIYQGITTIIGGNCGSSLAPLANHDIIKSIQKWANIQNINLNWLRMGEFLQEVERVKLSVNFGTLVGHSTLRRGIIRDEVRSLTDGEIKVIKKMLQDALREGALGLSTGLVYTHAKLASEKEISQIADVVADCGGVYATHIRGEAEELSLAIEEAVRIAQKSQVKLEISHLKAMGETNWPLMDKAVKLIEEARAVGVDVNFDVYPYTMTGSVLYILLPDWAAEGGKKMMLRRLKDPALRARVVAEMRQRQIDYTKITLSISPLNKKLARKNIAEIARAQGVAAEEAVIDILIASEGRAIALMDVLSEENMLTALQHPLAIIASNGAGYDIASRQTGDVVHPRNFGAFARVLSRYVRQQEIMSWEEAVRKMSGAPAEKVGLKDRGVLQKNKRADVLVFDPKNIDDMATAENPYQYSKGMDWVVVNGRIAVEAGKFNGGRFGEVLRR